MQAFCEYCGAEYNPKRLELGYRICLECGEAESKKEADRRKSQVAPLYNKGGYQYITSVDQAKDIGRK